LVRSQFTGTFRSVSTYLEGELIVVFGSLVFPGTLLVFLSMFFFISIVNFMGLFPRVFTRSRHLSMTLTLSLVF